MRPFVRTSALLLLFIGVAQAASIPKLVARHFDSNFVPASLSNGFIGIRPGANPLIAITSLPPDLVGKPGTAAIATVVPDLCAAIRCLALRVGRRRPIRWGSISK